MGPGALEDCIAAMVGKGGAQARDMTAMPLTQVLKCCVLDQTCTLTLPWPSAKPWPVAQTPHHRVMTLYQARTGTQASDSVSASVCVACDVRNPIALMRTVAHHAILLLAL